MSTHSDIDRTDTDHGDRADVGTSRDGYEVAQREGELLATAAKLVRSRRELGRYPELSVASANRIANTLTTMAIAQPPATGPGAGVDRAAGVALAHRVLDDDHPEDTELWTHLTHRALDQPTGSGSSPAGGVGPVLPDPRDRPDDGLG